MATTRERRMARADRLDGWAAGQAAKGEAKLEQGRRALAQIPLGQPVMPDHHSYRRDVSYRRKAVGAIDAGLDASRKAESMASRAANIRAATDRSIFDDDDNAVDALQARIDDLEAQRAAIVAFNKAARKTKGDDTLLAEALLLLPEDWRRTYLTALKQDNGYMVRKGYAMPSYVLSNLSGNIGKQRKRLEQLERRAALAPGTVVRTFVPNKYAGDCRICEGRVDAGVGVAERLHGEGWTVRHNDCGSTDG